MRIFHEIFEFHQIIKELKKLTLKIETHSSGWKNLKNVDIYIVDTFGETQKFHEISSSAFITVGNITFSKKFIASFFL